jgi:23S rRNA (cytidine1920-2'-O)/16S rRNA (cytidine1409-2'-O)-methyltransferase
MRETIKKSSAWIWPKNERQVSLAQSAIGMSLCAAKITKAASLRLDQALVQRALCPSREKARRAILAGQVLLRGHTAKKPSDLVKPGDDLALAVPERYVSRGGFKLEHGLRHFQLDPRGLTAIDLGASTGGFTDCLLQHGAAKVFAVDVGRGQLAWKLRQDPRVVVMERTNARNLAAQSFPQPFAGADLVVADCSFISLRKIIPAAVALLRRSGKMLALVKPQFEAGKAEADRGAGVITDPAVHARVLRELREFLASAPGILWRGETESSLLGPAGNKEFLVLLEKTT